MIKETRKVIIQTKPETDNGGHIAVERTLIKEFGNKVYNCLPKTQDFAKPKRHCIKSDFCPVSIRENQKKMIDIILDKRLL